jgi:hypothetical protein
MNANMLKLGPSHEGFQGPQQKDLVIGLETALTEMGDCYLNQEGIATGQRGQKIDFRMNNGQGPIRTGEDAGKGQANGGQTSFVGFMTNGKESGKIDNPCTIGIG